MGIFHYIFQDTRGVHINGVVQYFPETTEYSVTREGSVEGWWCNHYKNLYRRAKTRVLDIEVCWHLTTVCKTKSTFS